MVSIILLWNVDPSESAVTLPLGRLLKVDLEKRGHDIRLVKAPYENSIYAEFARIVQSGHEPMSDDLFS
jgi:hypothetical protein